MTLVASFNYKIVTQKSYPRFFIMEGSQSYPEILDSGGGGKTL
jgi:hypothetical protein